MTKVVKPMGGDGANEWMKRICPRLLHLRYALEKQHLFRGSLYFQPFFCLGHVERATAQH